MTVAVKSPAIVEDFESKVMQMMSIDLNGETGTKPIKVPMAVPLARAWGHPLNRLNFK